MRWACLRAWQVRMQEQLQNGAGLVIKCWQHAVEGLSPGRQMQHAV